MALAPISADALLNAYAHGLFPMAEGANQNEFFLVKPKLRGILPLHSVHVPRKLRHILRSDTFDVRFDTHFPQVIDACAEISLNRTDTWINPPIRDLFLQLFDRGFVHSVETWRNNELVGGLYGLSLGGAFFGESMFHRESNASKVALMYLAAHLKSQGYRLLDTQFYTSHLARFGAKQLEAKAFQSKLHDALQIDPSFSTPEISRCIQGRSVLHVLSQTS